MLRQFIDACGEQVALLLTALSNKANLTESQDNLQQLRHELVANWEANLAPTFKKIEAVIKNIEKTDTITDKSELGSRFIQLKSSFTILNNKINLFGKQKSNETQQQMLLNMQISNLSYQVLDNVETLYLFQKKIQRKHPNLSIAKIFLNRNTPSRIAMSKPILADCIKILGHAHFNELSEKFNTLSAQKHLFNSENLVDFATCEAKLESFKTLLTENGLTELAAQLDVNLSKNNNNIAGSTIAIGKAITNQSNQTNNNNSTKSQPITKPVESTVVILNNNNKDNNTTYGKNGKKSLTQFVASNTPPLANPKDSPQYRLTAK